MTTPLPPEPIRFEPMTESDLPHIIRWFDSPFVQQWYSYGEPATEQELIEHYLPRTRPESLTRAFLIYYGNTPIGYIQTYRVADYPDYARYVAVDEDVAGLDLFIGEAGYIHRGLGGAILREFLRDVVFATMDIRACVVGPDPANRAAIRAYEKAGFRYVKTIQVPNEPNPEYLMSMDRSSFVVSSERSLLA